MIGKKNKAKKAARTAEKARKNGPRTLNFEELKQDIMFNSRVVGIPDGAAETIAIKIAEKVLKWSEQRPIITTEDLDQRIATESKRFNKDLSYVYRNRGKII